MKLFVIYCYFIFATLDLLNLKHLLSPILRFAQNDKIQNNLNQNINYWKILATVTTKQQSDKSGKYQVSVPIFSDDLQKLNNKEILLKGYIIPLQELRKQNYFVLSRYPYSLCYFCGGAGIESVIEVNSTKDIKFTENAVTLKGIFKLNPTNPNQLLYILNDAEVVKE